MLLGGGGGGGTWEGSGFFLFSDGALMHVWCWWK